MNEVKVSLPKGQRIFVETSIANQCIAYALPSLLMDLRWQPCTYAAPSESKYDHSLTWIASSPLSDWILSDRACQASTGIKASTPTSTDIATARFARDLIECHVGQRISEITLRTINGKVRGLHNPSATPYRSVLTWVAGRVPASAALVPAPPGQIEIYLADLVAFLQRDHLPESLALAMAYYQFLTVHPFKDANGRVARLLVALHSRRCLSSARGIILAAGLSAWRECAARCFGGVFEGDCDRYLAFWAALECWCASVAEFAVRSLREMRTALSERLGPIPWKERFVASAELAPQVPVAELRRLVQGSDRLVERYVCSLERDEVIRRLEGRESEEWMCVDALAHWERVRTFAATRIAETPFFWNDEAVERT